jgi:hypothetical protein
MLLPLEHLNSNYEPGMIEKMLGFTIFLKCKEAENKGNKKSTAP